MGTLAGLTAFDIAVLAVVGLSALLALARGAVREVLGLVTWIGAVMAAIVAFAPVRPLVTPYIQEPLLGDAATLALVFIVPFVALKIVSRIIAGVISLSPLGPFDRLLGFGFGALRGALIVCAAYLVVSAFVPFDRQPAWVRNATLLPQVQHGSLVITRLLPQGMPVFDQIAGPARVEEPPIAKPAAQPARPAEPRT
jgi:membrane protein required for colicin V production